VAGAAVARGWAAVAVFEALRSAAAACALDSPVAASAARRAGAASVVAGYAPPRSAPASVAGFGFPVCRHRRSRRWLPWRWLGLAQRLGLGLSARRISVRRNSWLLRLLLALGWLRVGSISVISRITDTRLIPTLGTRVTGEHVSVPSNAPVLGCNRQRWSSASPPTDKAGGLTPSECLGDEPTFRLAYRRRFRRFGLSILEGNFRRHGRPYVSCLTAAASAEGA
jgi:hypothetical protein